MKEFVSPLLAFLFLNGLAIALLWRNYKRLINKYRILLCIFTTVFILLWILSTPYVAASLNLKLMSRVYKVTSEPITDIDVVVVLAAGLKSYDDPNQDELVLPYRVINGARMFKKYQAKLMVLSGGVGVEGNNRMVNVMKKLATELGVPENQIILEPRSRNTYEHAINISEMKEVRHSDRIGLVTSVWHMPRALNEFKKKFSSVVPVVSLRKITFPAGPSAWLPNVASLSSNTILIQEYVGMIWYYIRHRLDDYSQTRS